MKKLIYAGLACFMLLAAQAGSRKCTTVHFLMKRSRKPFLNQFQTRYTTKS